MAETAARDAQQGGGHTPVTAEVDDSLGKEIERMSTQFHDKSRSQKQKSVNRLAMLRNLRSLAVEIGSAATVPEAETAEEPRGETTLQVKEGGEVVGAAEKKVSPKFVNLTSKVFDLRYYWNGAMSTKATLVQPGGSKGPLSSSVGTKWCAFVPNGGDGGGGGGGGGGDRHEWTLSREHGRRPDYTIVDSMPLGLVQGSAEPDPTPAGICKPAEEPQAETAEEPRSETTLQVKEGGEVVGVAEKKVSPKFVNLTSKVFDLRYYWNGAMSTKATLVQPGGSKGPLSSSVGTKWCAFVPNGGDGGGGGGGGGGDRHEWTLSREHGRRPDYTIVDSMPLGLVQGSAEPDPTPAESVVTEVTISPQTEKLRTAVEVLCVFRPLHEGEAKFESTRLLPSSGLASPWSAAVSLERAGVQHTFDLDRCWDESSGSQEAVFEHCAGHKVASLFRGQNGVILAYGQSGAGKSYIMTGDKLTGKTRGIIPRCCDNIFTRVRLSSPTTCTVKCSYLQVHNEQITDLLQPSNTDLALRECPGRVYVEGLTQTVVSSASDVRDLIFVATTERPAAGGTRPRGHTVFVVEVEQVGEDRSMQTASLHLIDLADRDASQVKNAIGEETNMVNNSLSAIGLVLKGLSDGDKQAQVPYHNSKLTVLLQGPLSSNSSVSLVCACSPHAGSIEETLSTLKFAQRIKVKRQEVAVSGDFFQHQPSTKLIAQMAALKAEVHGLRAYSHSLEATLKRAGISPAAIGENGDDQTIGVTSRTQCCVVS